MSHRPQLMAKPSSYVIATSATGAINLTPTRGERQVQQVLTNALSVPLSWDAKAPVVLNVASYDSATALLQLQNPITRGTLYKYMPSWLYGQSTTWTVQHKWMWAVHYSNGTQGGYETFAVTPLAQSPAELLVQLPAKWDAITFVSDIAGKVSIIALHCHSVFVDDVCLSVISRNRPTQVIRPCMWSLKAIRWISLLRAPTSPCGSL